MVKQRTIKKTVKARGVGIHSGKVVNLTLIPAAADHGEARAGGDTQHQGRAHAAPSARAEPHGGVSARVVLIQNT